MGDGGRLALAILVIFIAMVCFFFTFHPGGVSEVSNPAQILQWLFGQFSSVTGAITSTDATVNATEASALNYPGYTSSSDTASVPASSGIQVDLCPVKPCQCAIKEVFNHRVFLCRTD